MTLLEDLKSILLPGHTLTIKALDKDNYYKDWNKTSKNVKYLYCLQLYCPNSRAGQGFLEHDNFTLADIAPSKLSNNYYKTINALLKKYSNGKMYISCTTECGTNIEYQIIWNRNRALAVI